MRDFLRDLGEHPRGDLSKRHFLGTVLLAAKPPGDFRSRFDVVDGQQRLTTATIFAIVALARISKYETLRSRAEHSVLPCVVGGGRGSGWHGSGGRTISGAVRSSSLSRFFRRFRGVETPLRCSHASSAWHQDESIAHLHCRQRQF